MCERHTKHVRSVQDQHRGSARSRGYSRRWERESRLFLRAHPLCQCPDCLEGEIRVVPAEVVDHIKPHKGNPVLFWDTHNWQAMSAACHNRKTALEDGAFGRPVKER